MTDPTFPIDRTAAIALTVGRDMWSTAEAAGAPSAKMADGPMGIASGRVDERDLSVLTPSGVSLGATWDVDLVARVGAIVGGEAKRLGVDMILAPNLNLARSPLAGRAFELYSEDPLLAGTLGAAWIGGVQSRHVGAVAKHLVCNDSETMRDRYDAVIAEAPLRETYLLPFEMAVAAGCAGLLAAYNKVNGDYCAESGHLLTRVVRQNWGFTGFTVSDWFGTHDTLRSATAGLDLEMPGPARHYGAKLEAAIAAGDVAEAGIAASAARIAAAAARWAGGDAGAEPGDRQAILEEAAAASFTLLKNDGALLPLVPGRHRRIALIGPNAAVPCFQGGTFAKIALRPDAVSPLDALRARYGADAEILFAPGCDPAPRLPSLPATPARDIGDGCARGLTVDFFDSHNFALPPIASETRDTNSLAWFGGMPGIGAFDRPAGIRAAGRYTPAKSGLHRLHIGGTGAVTLKVDGETLFAAEREIAPGDIMGVLKGGDSDSIELMLEAGRPILFEAELRFTPARAQGLWYGIRAPGDSEALLAEAEAAARAADAVVLVVGETADSGVESKDRTTTRLPDEQLELIARVCAANPNVAILANVAHAIDTGFAASAPALMIVWYPGEEFGPALAAVLAGDREPAGRLPVSFAADEADYPVLDTTPSPDGILPYAEGSRLGYRGLADRGVRPAWAFGFGLGYGAILFESAQIADAAAGRIAVTVRNAGTRDAAAVVQAYRTDAPLLLAGFARALVPAGGRATIALTIDWRALRRWTADGWAAPAATVRLGIGGSSVDLPLSLDLPA